MLHSQPILPKVSLITIVSTAWLQLTCCARFKCEIPVRRRVGEINNNETHPNSDGLVPASDLRRIVYLSPQVGDKCKEA